MNKTILNLIDYEVRRQDKIWKDRDNNTQLKWNCILTEEVGEVSEIVNDIDNSPDTDIEAKKKRRMIADLKEELTHVSAVCVSWLRALQGGDYEPNQ